MFDLTTIDGAIVGTFATIGLIVVLFATMRATPFAYHVARCAWHGARYPVGPRLAADMLCDERRMHDDMREAMVIGDDPNRDVALDDARRRLRALDHRE